MLRHDWRQLGQRASRDIAGQHQVEHCHEMAFAGTEAAVQIRCLAGSLSQRRTDHAECLVEAKGELRCRDVVAHGFAGTIQPLAQAQDEVALMHPLGDCNQVRQLGHARLRNPAVGVNAGVLALAA